MRVLGADTGASKTALVVIDGTTVVSHVTVRTDSAKAAPSVVHVGLLMHKLEAMPRTPDLVAVEAIRNPVGPRPNSGSDLRMLRPLQAILAGSAAGAVAMWAALTGLPVVVIPPSRHGKGLYAAYPKALHDPMGGCHRGRACDAKCAAPRGQRADERSAYDVAVAGRAAYRLAAAP